MRIFPLVAGAICFLFLSTAFGQAHYSVTKIPGNAAVPADMNNFGEVVGNYTANDGTSHAFLYFFGKFLDLTISLRHRVGRSDQ